MHHTDDGDNDINVCTFIEHCNCRENKVVMNF